MSIVSGSHLISGRTKSVLHLPLMNEHNRSITDRGMKGPELLKSELRVVHVVEALRTANRERDEAKAQLKTVKKERDNANKRVILAIAEWYRLEKAAYGAP